jgi:hypothetical protein
VAQEVSAERIGTQLGNEVAEHGGRHAASFCEHERQRIETANEPHTSAIRAKIALLQEEDRHLQERISKAPPAVEAAKRKRKMFYYWSIALLLSAATYIFAVLALEPYRLGWKAWLYCLGIAIVTPFLVDRVLELWASDKFIKVVQTGACLAAISSLVLIAVIRGDLLAQEMGNAAPAVVFNGDTPIAPQAENSFYKETLILLRFVMACLALAMETGAGYAVYEARRWGTSGENAAELHEKLVAVREEMIACGRELRLKENEAAHFEEQFWRDFSRSMLNGAKEAVKRVSLVLLFLAILGHTRASAADRINLVVAVDLTASVSAVGPDSKAEFDKNLAAAGRLLAQIPAGTHITVLGITEQSFSQPYMLLSAELSPDEGYFKERLAAGRNQVVRAWQQRTVQLAARSKETDLLGAVTVASQLFQQDGRRNILVIFSDMRHYTAALDLERPNSIAVAGAMAAAEKRRLIPNLKDVEVYVLGADGAGKTISYWQGLRDFWQAYFKKAGANVRTYTILRELPVLQ